MTIIILQQGCIPHSSIGSFSLFFIVSNIKYISHTDSWLQITHFQLIILIVTPAVRLDPVTKLKPLTKSSLPTSPSLKTYIIGISTMYLVKVKQDIKFITITLHTI